MNIFTISPSLPFLDTLVEGIFTKFSTINDDTEEKNKKEKADFSDITILLPNRRSCRYLKDAFIRYIHASSNEQTLNQSIILPKMYALGDIDENELFFLSQEIEEPFPQILPAISTTQKHLILAHLIKQWYVIEERSISFEQALKLAIDLSLFLDEMHKDKISFDNIEKLVPEDLAEHWQITIDFLKILSEKWPEILAEKNCCDNIERRNMLVDLQLEYWKKSPPKSPIIVAGSTGSVKSTAKLIKKLVEFKNGYLVLPYIDLTMKEKIWQDISNQNDEHSIHPQYMIAKLMKYIGAERKHVQNWHENKSSNIDNITDKSREEFISNAMLPGKYISDWKIYNFHKECIKNVSLINANSQNDEAKIISFIFRNILENNILNNNIKTATLITQDVDLIKRVKSMMLRWDIDIKISSGVNLLDSMLVQFLCSICNAASSNFASVELLALLKQPLCQIGDCAVAHKKYSSMLEKYILRGSFLSHGLESIEDNISILIPDNEVDNFYVWFKKLKKSLHDISNIFQNINSKSKLDTLIKTHMKSAELLSTKITMNTTNDNLDLNTDASINLNLNSNLPNNDMSKIWQLEESEAVSNIIDEVILSSSKDDKYYVRVKDYSEIFKTLMSTKYYPKKDSLFPQISILSPIEARMLKFDLVILGSLNESIWTSSNNLSWMSKDMRQNFGLSSFNKVIGQSAHDFCSLFCTKEVIITRPAKINGVKTVESPWISRILALLDMKTSQDFNTKNTGIQDILKPAIPWQKWIEDDIYSNKENNSNNITSKHFKPIAKPMPCPDVKYRPKKYSATAIATLMKDPYSIYAKYILHLYPINELDAEPEALEFGNLAHKIFERFVLETQGKGEYPALISIAKEEFNIYDKYSNVIKLWWPRFNSIAQYFYKKNQEILQEGVELFVEEQGELKLNIMGHICLLTAKADRIEYDKNSNSANIIDYKTGNIPPPVNKMKNGLCPQLAIEALILQNAGYKNISKITPKISNITKIENWHLSVDKKNDNTNKIDMNKENITDLIIQTEKNLCKLLEIFMDNNTPYLASPNLKNIKDNRYNDYQHLSRIKEWF